MICNLITVFLSTNFTNINNIKDIIQLLSMILEILGIIHIIHCPLLIIYPFIIINQKIDIYYLTYFFFICFSYTFINGECPISYVSKIIKKNYCLKEKCDEVCENDNYVCENDNYVCENERNFPKEIGENERNFPEMASILPICLYPYIYYYFIVNTKIYLFSLFLVIYRNNLYNVVYFPFSVLSIYFLFVYFFINNRFTISFITYFKIYQQFTKVILLLTIYFFLESQRFELNFVSRHLRNECILN
jgi:hypothetical protein